ncbi:hypothetical protein H9L39_00529 [Fusarium oxysporum f. sp. albedinis]|nr:hypothetical protein H9L39_00529 [Fusarium oxysporum f. sp. albedinis]
MATWHFLSYLSPIITIHPFHISLHDLGAHSILDTNNIACLLPQHLGRSACFSSRFTYRLHKLNKKSRVYGIAFLLDWPRLLVTDSIRKCKP